MPAGRKYSTTMINANTAISRRFEYHRPISDSSSPIRKPPKMQPRGFSSPPRMAAEKALSESRVPTNTEAVVIGATMTPAMAASAELIANTATATALALMPIRLAVVLLNATARTALPILVLRRAQSNTIINASVTPNTRISAAARPRPGS